MKKIFTIVSILCSAALMISCGSNASKQAEEETAQAAADSVAAVQKELSLNERMAALPEEPEFEIITNLGTIKVRLYSKTAKHRANFARLALGGYYDGLLFHRVINGFMIQGGDPLTRDIENKSRFGTGGPDYTVPAEILPDYRHKKGALAAARRGDAANPLRESSGSQFYIVQDEAACAFLDGQYTVFGETVDGFATIDKIAAVAVDGRDCPVNEVKIIKVKLCE